MNEFQAKSLNTNLELFVKPLSDLELVELTDYFNYCLTTKEPNPWVLSFAHEFIGEKEWNNYLSDVKTKPEFFIKASRNTHELVRVIGIWLLEESFRRYLRSFDNKTPSKEKILTKQDKSSLIEILDEHKSMLVYQLEDEDEITKWFDKDEGRTEVMRKKKHLKFLENVSWWKKI